MSKEYYTNFKAFIADLTAKEKAIRTDLEAYKTAIGNNDNTIEIEGRLNTDLKKPIENDDEFDIEELGIILGLKNKIQI